MLNPFFRFTLITLLIFLFSTVLTTLYLYEWGYWEHFVSDAWIMYVFVEMGLLYKKSKYVCRGINLMWLFILAFQGVNLMHGILSTWVWITTVGAGIDDVVTQYYDEYACLFTITGICVGCVIFALMFTKITEYLIKSSR